MPAKNESTVYIVDDDADARRSTKSLVGMVGLPAETFRNAVEFLASFDPDRPACLVLDVRMPQISGLELLNKLAAQECTIPVIMVTGFADVPLAVGAMKAGAVDVIEKPYQPQQLLESIQQALERDAVLKQIRAEQIDVNGRLARLTRRERQVLDLIVEGLSSKQIASRLELSPKTVHVHRSSLMDKLAARSPAELARIVVTARVRDNKGGPGTIPALSV